MKSSLVLKGAMLMAFMCVTSPDAQAAPAAKGRSLAMNDKMDSGNNVVDFSFHNARIKADFPIPAHSIWGPSDEAQFYMAYDETAAKYAPKDMLFQYLLIATDLKKDFRTKPLGSITPRSFADEMIRELKDRDLYPIAVFPELPTGEHELYLAYLTVQPIMMKEILLMRVILDKANDIAVVGLVKIPYAQAKMSGLDITFNENKISLDYKEANWAFLKSIGLFNETKAPRR